VSIRAVGTVCGRVLSGIRHHSPKPSARRPRFSCILSRARKRISNRRCTNYLITLYFESNVISITLYQCELLMSLRVLDDHKAGPDQERFTTAADGTVDAAISRLDELRRRYLIPVGTPVTERPPDRTVRAAFPHTAPTSGV
jgi:hypothetical protein